MRKGKGFGLLSVIIIIIFTAIVTCVATGVIMLNSSSSYNDININSDKDLKEFINLYETIISKYYDSDIDKSAMLNAAEEAMLYYLDDKYTTYLNNQEYNEIIDELSGSYNGVGVLIDGNRVVEVAHLSPAERAGIVSGDIIISIDNQNVVGKKAEELKRIINDSVSKTINVVISRGGEQLKFEIEKANLTVSYELIDENIGYIYIRNFSANLGDLVEKALNELESHNISGLIIDLRNNSGGYLSSAEEVASFFLEEGKIVYSLETSNSKYTYKDETPEKRNYKIIALINENSASASEVLAAALRDSYGAKLLGSKSYGKGKVQQIISLNNGDSVKYTSAKWLTPEGECIDGIGLMPDYIVERDTDLSYDKELTTAIDYLK